MSVGEVGADPGEQDGVADGIESCCKVEEDGDVPVSGV